MSIAPKIILTQLRVVKDQRQEEISKLRVLSTKDPDYRSYLRSLASDQNKRICAFVDLMTSE